ncbi:MAG: fibronectin type III-like domain-contianing protein [Cytophagales bacterium]|nr:fibronectin type III-like domain-contianing protein [Cytophagales bacterium]
MYNPSGKLPISFPRSVGHIPSYYATKKSATRGYVADTTTALYPFGYGLSYTTFEYSNLRLQKKVIEPKESVVVYVNIQNTGDYEGEEVVQLYIRDEVSSVVKPLRELRDFRKIRLKPGEMQTVGLELSFEKLALWDAHMQFRVEPGTFTSYIGGSSTNTMSEKIIVK